MVFGQVKKLWGLFIVLLAGVLTVMALLIRGGSEPETALTRIPPKDVYRIGILRSGSLPEEERLLKGFLEALAANGYRNGGRADITIFSGEGRPEKMESGVQALLLGKPDLVAVLGNEAAEAAAGAFHTTPVVGMGILGFRNAPWIRGHENFTGMESWPGVLAQVAAAKRLVPFQRLGVLYSAGDKESLMQLGWLRAAAERKNAYLYEIAVGEGERPLDRASDFIGHADAVYIAEDENVLKEFDQVVQVLTRAGIPIIGGEENMVRRGALISVSEDYYRMGFEAGKIADTLLKGGALPAEIPIRKQKENDLVVNMAAADAFHIKLPSDIWQKARKLYLYDGEPARP